MDSVFSTATFEALDTQFPGGCRRVGEQSILVCRVDPGPSHYPRANLRRERL
jgi:hypothetical protein